jgi:limonene-1,2-epoxide hydrolase
MAQSQIVEFEFAHVFKIDDAKIVRWFRSFRKKQN